MTGTEIISAVASELKDPSNKRFSSAFLLTKLQEVIDMISKLTSVKKVRAASITLVAGTAVYSLASDFLSGVGRVRVDNGTYDYELVPMDHSPTGKELSTSSGLPTRIWNEALANNQIGIYPVPAADHLPATLYYDYTALLTNLTVAGDSLDTTLRTDVQRKVYLGVCWLALRSSDDPMELRKGEAYQAQFMRELIRPLQWETGSQLERKGMIA